MMKLIANKGGNQLIHIYVDYCNLAAEETILSFKMLKFSEITSLKNPIFVKYKYLKQLQPLRKHPAESTTFIPTHTHNRICSMISILYTSL
jgi:predicted nucleotide-binding protein (sugar kinase/HSP70/actin superfamily)